MEIGLLLLRVVIGALFVGHGTQKLFGWFSGPGIEGTRDMFASLGYRRPRQMAALAGTTEAVSGALLVLGFLMPLAAAGVIGVMVNAVASVHLRNGLWNTAGGYEYNLVLIAGATALAMTGPGVVSLDPAFGLPLSGVLWGVTALLLGLVVASGVLATRTTPDEVEAEEAERVHERDERRAA